MDFLIVIYGTVDCVQFVGPLNPEI